MIDWHNKMWVDNISYGQTHLQPFSAVWSGAALTDYAANCKNCVRAWERWAEALTVWVFGQYNVNGDFHSSYGGELLVNQLDLNNQMALMTGFLGW